MLRDCLRSLPAATEGLTIETYVVDNNSPDDSVAMVQADFPDVCLIANKDNAGFTKANNQAIRLCTGRFVLLLNPDTEAESGSLTLLARYLETHPEVGAVGPKLLNTDGSLQPNGRRFPTPWLEFLGHTGLRRFLRKTSSPNWECDRDDFDVEWETDLITGACLMTRREVIEQIGMLDEDFFMFYEETEWCWRAKKAGWKILYVPQSRVTHHWMGSVRQQSRAMTIRLLRSMLVYYRKTGGFGAQLGARGVFAAGMFKNEVLHLGVAVKRRLRAARLLR